MLKPCRRCTSAFNALRGAQYCEGCKSLPRPDPGNPARQARYRERHRAQINERQRLYQQTPEHRALLAARHDRDRFNGLRAVVLERDGYQCKKCATPQLPGTRNLVVHHIDEDRTSNTLANLETLCRSCHPHIHGRQSPESQAKRSESLRRAWASRRSPNKR